MTSRPEDFDTHDYLTCQICIGLRQGVWVAAEPFVVVRESNIRHQLPVETGQLASSHHAESRAIDYLTPHPESFLAAVNAMSDSMTEIQATILETIAIALRKPLNPWYRHPLKWGKYLGFRLIWKTDRVVSRVWAWIKRTAAQAMQLEKDVVRILWLAMMTPQARAEQLAREAEMQHQIEERSSQMFTVWNDAAEWRGMAMHWERAEPTFTNPEDIPNPTDRDRARWAAEMDTEPEQGFDGGVGELGPESYARAPLDEKDDLPDLMDRITAELSGWQEQKGGLHE